MDVAASIAGLISLGIQVTQSLIDYYTAYKGRETDVADTTKKLNRLSSMLESLRCHLVDRKFPTGDQDLLETIEGALRDCEGFIHELQNQYDKFKDNSTSGVQAKALTAARKLAYPFRRTTLEELNDTVDEIAAHLSLALQSLQLKNIDRIQNDTEDTKRLLELVRANQISLDVRSWLNAPDATINYNEACKKRYGGTGLWLVKSPVFFTWLTKPNSFLWLNGFAGCGKSVLCSTAIQHAFRHRRSNPRIGIAFFFFAFNENGKQDTAAMLRALVLQLSGQLDDNYGLLSRLYTSYRNATPPDQALLDCLRQLVREFDGTCIILDALDECPRNTHRRDMLQALADMRAWSEPGLHLLVTSRDEPDIRDMFVDECRALQDEIISMKNDSVDNDIASFIFGSLKTDRRLRKWEKYHDQIKEVLTERAKGVFRWVECQFIALDSCVRSKRRLDILLASLPQSLDETYERMLLNIGEESIEDARRILTFLCCAKGPLTIPEIIEGVATELGDNPQLNVDARLDNEDDIHRLCPGLIEVDYHHGSKESTVRIAHFSVQEYLESERIHEHAVAIFGIRKPNAHAEIACICLTYLLGLGSSMSITKYPLTLYAAQNWYKHYHDGNQNLYPVQRQAIRLFQSASVFKNWVRIWDLEFFFRREKVVSPIYYASLLGLNSVLSELLSGKPSTGFFSGKTTDLVNIQCGSHGNALQAASAQGHEKIVQLLLAKGANIHAQGGLYGSALQAASTQGHEKIVQLLVDKGANIHAQGGHYGNALEAALIRGHENIVHLLLDKGADIHTQGGYYGNALQAASVRGNEKIVQLLLDKGADVHAQGGYYGNALQAASTQGHENIVHLLLDKGADIHTQGGLYRNALQAASVGGDEKIVQLLLDKGADIYTQGGHYGNALQAASVKGSEEIVQLLLDTGADVHAQGGHYGNALQAASLRGHENIVHLLLDKGANIHTQGGYFENALQAASVRGNEKIVQLLLDKGADVHAQGGYYGNALQAASTQGHENIVHLLIDKGADIHTQGGHYGNALQAASVGGDEKIVQLLLDKGADVHAQGGLYGNALQAALIKGHEKIVQLLLDKGADIHTQGGLYGNALQAASLGGYEKIVQLLLDKGADIHARLATTETLYGQNRDNIAVMRI